jgi:hypothetical protein
MLCSECNTKEGRINKFLPLFFHNLSGYDGHLVFLELAKRNQSHINLDRIISKSKDTYISFQYGCIRFLDSYRFFANSLENVAKSLPEEAFKLTRRFLVSSELNDTEALQLLRQKGIYPYDWVQSQNNFNETELPPKEAFYSKLYDEEVSEEDYQHAVKIWKTFKCRTFLDYHNLYLRTDVLILADALENFRNFFKLHHNIDPVHTYSAPGLTEKCGKKYCGEIWNKAYDVIF